MILYRIPTYASMPHWMEHVRWTEPEPAIRRTIEWFRHVQAKNPLAFVAQEHLAYFGMPEQWKRERERAERNASDRVTQGVTQRFRCTAFDAAPGVDPDYKVKETGRPVPAVIVETQLEAQVIRLRRGREERIIDGRRFVSEDPAVQELEDWRPFRAQRLVLGVVDVDLTVLGPDEWPGLGEEP